MSEFTNVLISTLSIAHSEHRQTLLSCLPRVLEPVDDVVDVQRLLPPPGLEGVEGGDVLLDLEAGGVVVLSEP